MGEMGFGVCHALGLNPYSAIYQLCVFEQVTGLQFPYL